ncbi:sterile alpha motif domain-containing protein 9-like isoform X2 [Ostrea edulis]|uniref:sterile alpha motif domain-containing protein 9-like isoform X2 n=1 Tax=Ostrea edulis TaxID=37623 RepID=UPI0024AFE010|nr:sterile alpha motif domain-containing protein 9-like isoform X2 [Ostrea edulis]
MNSEEKLKIQINYCYLVNELRTDDVVDNLFTECVIDHDDMQRVNAEKTDRDKVKCLISILYSKENAFEPFLKELGQLRPDVKEKLQSTDIEEELRTEIKKRREFLSDVIRKRYCLRDGKSVAESDLLWGIELEYWKNGKGVMPQDTKTDLMECMKLLFPTAIRKKIAKKRKKVWKYCNLDRQEAESSDEDEESEIVTEKEIKQDRGGVLCLLDTHILFKDVKASEMKLVLAPYMEKEGIEAVHLEVFDRQKIDGQLFSEFDMVDLGQAFGDMPVGDRKRLQKIVQSILKEELEKGPFLLIPAMDSETTGEKIGGVTKTQYYSKRAVSESEEGDSETKFKEIFRTFDTRVKPSDAYRKHAVFRTSNFHISDLIEPLHCFRQRDDLDHSSLLTWIAEETIRFAGACFSDRTNGTVHFGIAENTNKDGILEGKVVGLQINQLKFMEVFYQEIQQAFYKDQLGIVLQCLRPPQFVHVQSKMLTEEAMSPLFVVEIDIVPSYSLTNHDTFYIREKKEKEVIPRIYKFDKNIPKALRDDEFKNYMTTKSKIAEHRNYKEKTALPSKTDGTLRDQFLNFYTAGSEKLTNDIYPILFLSPLDSAMSEDFVSDNFEFLLNMEPTAIFDFHSSLDGKCLYNFVEADLERVVKVYTTDNFDRNSEENANNPDSLNNVLEELRTSQLKPWIFCNGYEPLEKPPLNRLEWKKRRSEGFKEVTRFLQQEIPNERALIVFLILSKNYDIMLEVAEEVILKFQNQWIAMSENERLMESWQEELLRRDSVDKKTLIERCIIGLPWKHVNNIVKEVSTLLPMMSKCQLPTSAGAFCYLKEKIRNELCDLEILSSSECEIDEICSDTHKLEMHRQYVEEKFYKGGHVTWWNLYFEDNHVLRRSQQEKIQEGVEKLLERRVEDTWVPCFYLFHQPGAGGTTTAHQILWQFRKKYRCALIRKVTDQTCVQLDRLRFFEDPDNPKPPIILIDNGDEEKVRDLHARMEHRARTSGKSDAKRIYCLLLLCIRRANLPISTDSHTVQLKHELTAKELEWLRRKYQSLDEMYKNNKGVDPKLLISFNILKENFDSNYIERTVKEFVDSINVEKEKYLIKYLSLINSYDIDFQSVPLSAFDTMMDERRSNTILSMGSVTGRRCHPSNLCRNWESTLSQSTVVLLNRNARVSAGVQVLSIVSKLFAKAILDYIVRKENLCIGDVMIEFLKHPLFLVENASTRQLKKIVQDVLKKREFTVDQKKEMFSPVILKVEEKEGKDKAAAVLETGYEKTKDPMLAQQIARFYIHVGNWEKAEQFAKLAVDSKPDNSYLWDTYGQIYKRRLTDKYKEYIADSEAPNDVEIQEILKLAMKGIEKFSKEQRVSEKSHFGRENDAGYFGEVRLIVQLLDLMYLWFPEKDSKSNLHTYLVKLSNPREFDIFSEESRKFLNNLQNRSEKTMQIIEDKLAQLKSEKEGEIFKLNTTYNPRHELVQLRENLDNYLGEQTGEIPNHLTPDSRASFIRRRVVRLGGRSSSSILDLRHKPKGEQHLEEMALKLLENTKSLFAGVFDFVTLITVKLVQNMSVETIREEDFKNLVEWSRKAYEMTLQIGENERPHLEAFMYFVMIHWPTENKRKYRLSPVETVQDAIKRWKNAFYKNHPKQKDEPFRRRETTYYFLGKGDKVKEIVYSKELRCKQSYLDGEALWRSQPVKDMLQQLKGTLLNDGWEILHTVISQGGNKSFIKVRNSHPSPRSLWQKSVVFYLGFGWNGPKAYIQTDQYSQDEAVSGQMQEEEGGIVPHIKQPSNPGKQTRETWQDVATHEAYLNTLRKIKVQLKEIERLKKTKNLTQKQISFSGLVIHER